MKVFTFRKVATSWNFTKNELLHRYSFDNVNVIFIYFSKFKNSCLQGKLFSCCFLKFYNSFMKQTEILKKKKKSKLLN